MEPIFFLAGIYLCISVVAAIIAYHLDISIALVEICLGVATAASSGYSSSLPPAPSCSRSWPARSWTLR
jgi:hypothetical protein